MTRVTADIYLALPDNERAAVQSMMASRLGQAWFGAANEIDDYAVTRPAYGASLAAALNKRGHLSREYPETMTNPYSTRVPLSENDRPLEVAFARRRPPRKREKAVYPPGKRNNRQISHHHHARPQPVTPNPAPQPPPGQRPEITHRPSY